MGKMTSENFRAYREARDKQMKRYEENWDYVSNGHAGHREAWSYTRKNQNSEKLTKVKHDDLGFQAWMAYRLSNRELDFAMIDYNFAESLERDEIEKLWAVYSNEGVHIELFVACIRELVLDGEKANMANVNKRMQSAKIRPARFKLGVSIAELLRRKGMEING